MFQHLNKLIKSARIPKLLLAPRKMKDSKGQIAVVIILFIGVLFIFFAIVLNLGRIAQVKNTVTVASNVAAAAMASQFASYGEMLYQVNLGGDDPDGADDDLTKCGWTGVAAIILSMFIMAIMFLTGQVELIVFIMAMFLSAVGLVMQSMIVQPGLTEMWNKQMEPMQPQDQFLERGISFALQNAVDDTKEVLDTIDIDMDGRFAPSSVDMVGRFGYHYHARLRDMRPDPHLDVLLAFLQRLEQFLYDRNIKYTHNNYPDFLNDLSEDHWGIWDPVLHACYNFETEEYLSNGHPCCDYTNSDLPSGCNACCVPEGVRSLCCEENLGGATEICPSPGTCPSDGINPEYVYDPFYENDLNNTIGAADFFMSFRERLGHDDGNKNLRTLPEENGGVYYKYTDDQGYDIPQEPDEDWRDFRRGDATGIYPILWEVSRYAQLGEENCFWCDDQRLVSGGSGGGIASLYECIDEFYYYRAGFPLWDIDLAKLRLSEDCTGTDCCIHFQDDDPPLWMDTVSDADDMNIMKENPPTGERQCYFEPASVGWWKDGSDDFCSEVWPYYLDCPGKHCSSSCADPCSSGCSSDDTCWSNGPEDHWREDEVDELRYGIEAFIDWARDTLDTNVGVLSSTFTAWYPTAYLWVTPDRAGGLAVGRLAHWRDYMRQWLLNLQNWRNQNTQDRAEPTTYCYSTLDPDYGSSAVISEVIECLEDYADGLEGYLQECYDYCDDPLRDPLELYANCRYPLVGLMNEMGGFVSQCRSGSSFMNELSNQIATAPREEEKFQFRADYLRSLLGRVNALIDQLDNDIAQFSDFVESDEVRALDDLYKEIINSPDLALPSQAVYGWQTDAPEGRDRGYWHIVYVQGAVPGRCDNQCMRHHFPEDPKLPEVKTYTTSTDNTFTGLGTYAFWIGPILSLFDTRRCYTLFDSKDLTGECDSEDDYKHNASACFAGGKTMARVIRYDEDKDLTLFFANHVPLWRFIFHHPQRGEASDDLITAMESACGQSDSDANGAFMVNKPEGPCWPAVIPLLERGVMSSSCAEYYFHKPNRDNVVPGSINVKFVPCDEESLINDSLR